MSVLGQFLLYNLLPALVAGILTWIVIFSALGLLRIDNGALRLPLLYVPLVKSTLVFLGLHLVLPWPREIFTAWQAQALSPGVLLPFFLVWVGLAYLGYAVISRRARRQVIAGARPAVGAAPNLVRAYEEAVEAMEHTACPLVESGWICCTVDGPLTRPEVMLSDEIVTPLVMITDQDPIIVFPAALVSRLDDAELKAAVAHELAHLTLRRPACFSSTTLERWTGINPISRLLANQLRQEEEKACDDMAVAALGQPDVYAEMLLKSYRFALEQAGSWQRRFRTVPQLLGARPGLTERIERLLQPTRPDHRYRVQRWATLGVWCLALAFFIS